MAEQFGIERIGFLTLTFPKDLTLKEANRRFNSFATHVGNSHFEAWMNVREFTFRGRPHMHLAVAVREDIRTGFNFENYLEMAWMTKNDRRRKKFSVEIRELSRSLNPTDHLRFLWSELRRELPKYGFGRHELLPIRKCAEAFALYVGGYIRKSVEARPPEAKGARLISYSKGFDRIVCGHAWQWNTSRTRLWRVRLRIFAEYHGLTDFSQLKETFGPKWAFWLTPIIHRVNLLPHLESLNDPELAVAFMESLDRIPNFKDSLSLFRNDGFLVAPPENPLNDEGLPIPLSKAMRPIYFSHAMRWNKPKSLALTKKQTITTNH
uniref:Uncharacterized protein n=1 Tax=uncultured prokaryote TaxID=198431 RepID=A0A0H5Q7E1_9ZZZZ|nr:hypothetical protein [uncultured prokaryote]